MNSEDIAVADFEEINEEQSQPKRPLSKSEKVKAIRLAVEEGHLNSNSANKMRYELGISNSDFTKKHISKSKRKKKRKAAKTARKKQR